MLYISSTTSCKKISGIWVTVSYSYSLPQNSSVYIDLNHMLPHNSCPGSLGQDRNYWVQAEDPHCPLEASAMQCVSGLPKYQPEPEEQLMDVTVAYITAYTVTIKLTKRFTQWNCSRAQQVQPWACVSWFAFRNEFKTVLYSWFSDSRCCCFHQQLLPHRITSSHVSLDTLMYFLQYAAFQAKQI